MHKEKVRICPCYHSLIDEESKQQTAAQFYLNQQSKQLRNAKQPYQRGSHKPTKYRYSFKHNKKVFSPTHETSRCNEASVKLQNKGNIAFSYSQFNNSQRYMSPLAIDSQRISIKVQPLSPRTTQLKTIRSPSFRGQIQSNTSVAPLHTASIRTIRHTQAGKMQGKRIKTAQQQTQYSSKHSQVFFKSPNDFVESCFQNKHNFSKKPKNIIFTEDNESQKSIVPQEIPSCQEVSPHQEVDNSVITQFLQNARTMQTIITSTQLRSKNHSRDPSHMFTFAKGAKSPSSVNSPPESSRQNYQPQVTINKSQLSVFKKSNQTSKKSSQNHQCHKRHSSPIYVPETDEPKISQNLFYSQQVSQKITKSPKISVLDIDDNDNSFEDELRDKIDQNLPTSKHCSKVNSPFVSLNVSTKNIEEKSQKSQKRVVNFDLNLSQQDQHELNLLTQLRAKTKRTNTIQSLCSSVSQKSQLDIKFMQRVRTRRQVSKLV